VIGDVSSPESGRRPSYKISRNDILAHAYAQCRSNKGAPGIDGQDFADINASGLRQNQWAQSAAKLHSRGPDADPRALKASDHQE
jgi:hypothetical protein